MGEIPEDIMEAAVETYDLFAEHPYAPRIEIIAQALLSERDRATAKERARCAYFANYHWGDYVDCLAAIRSGEEAGK